MAAREGRGHRSATRGAGNARAASPLNTASSVSDQGGLTEAVSAAGAASGTSTVPHTRRRQAPDAPPASSAETSSGADGRPASDAKTAVVPDQDAARAEDTQAEPQEGRQPQARTREGGSVRLHAVRRRAALAGVGSLAAGMMGVLLFHIAAGDLADAARGPVSESMETMPAPQQLAFPAQPSPAATILEVKPADAAPPPTPKQPNTLVAALPPPAAPVPPPTPAQGQRPLHASPARGMGVPPRKPKAPASTGHSKPVAPDQSGAQLGSAVMLTVGRSTAANARRALGAGIAERRWPDHTREITYRPSASRLLLVQGIPAQEVTLWFDPQGVLAAVRTQEPLPGFWGIVTTVAIVPI